MAEKKEKQYVSDNARLMAEWDCEKNTGLGFDPTKLTLGSHTKVWWKCTTGHEWEAVIASRNSGCGCPYCAGKKVVRGENDLQTINPTLSKEWNCEKNNGLMPTDVMPNSSQKVWWQCTQGHEWQATIKDRNSGCGCPYCAGKKVSKGFNDLQTVNPTISKQWHYEKNNGLTPADVTPNSHIKVWWKCSQGHEWQAMIAHRNRGSGCPVCRKDKNDNIS